MLAQPATFHDQRFSKSLSFAQDAPSGHSVDPFMNIHPLRAPLLTLGALWVGLAAFVWSTADQLPERVATHFGLGENPNSWMSRTGHAEFIMGFAIGLPVFLHLLFVVIRTFAGVGCNIPGRTSWLAPECRDATLSHVHYRFAWFICVLL